MNKSLIFSNDNTILHVYLFIHSNKIYKSSYELFQCDSWNVKSYSNKLAR